MYEFAQLSGGLFTALAIMSVAVIGFLFFSAFSVYGSAKLVGDELSFGKAMIASAASFFLSAIGHYVFIHFWGESVQPLALLGSIVVISFVVLGVMIFAMDEVDVWKSFATAAIAIIVHIVVVFVLIKITPVDRPFKLYREFKREVRGTELKVRRANYLARKKALEDEKIDAGALNDESYEYEEDKPEKRGRELLD